MRKAVGSKIRFYRERLGLSQEQLGLDVDLSKAAMSFIETGRSWPQYDNLDAIAKRLGVTVAAFFDDVRPEIRPTVDEALEVIRQALAERVQAPKVANEISPPSQAETPSNLAGVPQELIDGLSQVAGNPAALAAVAAVLKPFLSKGFMGTAPKGPGPRRST